MKALLISEIQVLFYLLTMGVITMQTFDHDVDQLNRELALVEDDHGY